MQDYEGKHFCNENRIIIINVYEIWLSLLRWSLNMGVKGKGKKKERKVKGEEKHKIIFNRGQIS